VVMDAKSRAGKAFTNSARRILGEDVPLEEVDAPQNLLDRLRRLLSPGARPTGKRA
jgi:septum site-determining protein MinD